MRTGNRCTSTPPVANGTKMMVSTPADLRQVLLGEGGLLVGDGPLPRVVVDCSTVSTESSEQMREACTARGVDFLNNSVMGSVFTRYKSPALVNLDYSPTFTPLLLRKDFDLGLAAARELDVPMPVAAVTAQLVQASVGTGRVDEDFAILLDLEAASAGLELKPENVVVDDGLGTPNEAG